MKFIPNMCTFGLLGNQSNQSVRTGQIYGVRLLFHVGWLLVTAAIALNVQSTMAQDAFPLQARRILFLGDSITHAGYYVADIEMQLRIQQAPHVPELVNLGLSSETCSGLSEPDHPFPRPDVHERLDRALEKVKPDVVVACYGMNDGIYHPFSPERFDAYQVGMRKLITKVHDAGAKIVLLTPPPFDPLPLKSKEGKLLPAGQQKYAWFAIYEDYDSVLNRYGQWVMTLRQEADMVIDVHAPLTEMISQQRRSRPDYHTAPDGIHQNEAGHHVMAAAVLKAWGVESWEEPGDKLRQLMNQKQKVLHDAWLTDVGHKRPDVRDGLPLPEARTQAATLEQQIRPLIAEAQLPDVSRRSSTRGTIHQLHFPAQLHGNSLRLSVDYYLWIPKGVSTLQGIVVHQHGCGPGASLGGRTAADDLHWQALAAKHDCALLGSSYEPRQGVNCRLWCDARRGSAGRFLQAVERFAEVTGHAELVQVPWCLWGHSGGGFWASLMQTLYPERIVAIWLQSGTAFGYWTSGEIEKPVIPDAAYGVPVMGNPGLKEKDDQRFHVAWDGIKAMQEDYRSHGAAFFEFAPDPRTGHECGDSRYLSIPFFDFWLDHRLSNDGSHTLQSVDAGDLKNWSDTMAGRLNEFIETGAVSDSTAPPAPAGVKAQRLDDGSVQLTWTATADFESGIGGFQIFRSGEQIGQIPEKPVGRFGRPLFQVMSYHDTPEQPLPRMTFTDTSAPTDQIPDYSVRTVNSVGLVSEPAGNRR